METYEILKLLQIAALAKDWPEFRPIHDAAHRVVEMPGFRDDVIEQCARVAESYDAATMKAAGLEEISMEIAAAIRALKDKQ